MAPARSQQSIHLRSMVHCGLAHMRAILGAQSRYEIFAGYRHREKATYFDDTGMADEWQKEVYLYAAELMRREGMSTVHDVGCGSGFKLMTYLADYATVGFDVPKTVDFLRKTYPDRDWRAVPFSDRSSPRADLVICADVIEHVPDPDELLDFIDSLATRHIIISTPERGLLYGPTARYRYGPPTNPTHLREWDIGELARYVGRRFTIIRHEITNHRQATQMIHCARG